MSVELAGRIAHELALFAACGFLLGGIDDLLVDMIWIGRTLWRRYAIYRHHPRASTAMLARPLPGRLAIFVPAWREEAVIGAMIATARTRFGARDWRLYVGTYPNDPETAAAVRRAARDDPRIRLVVGDAPGPTTKAGCLNWLWQAMRADERADRRFVKAVILHDAEDAVHREELAVYDSLIDRFDLVQLPVEPVAVRDRGWWARFVSLHYAGEFAEAHRKQVVVREALGAAVPSAGVGCAIGRHMLARAALNRDGPFDPDSLTEDYELGLRIGEAGGRGVLAAVRANDGSGLVAVRACFPATLSAAIRQKSRWVAGIALAGWDRLGWRGGLAEHWMRLRDRRAPLAAMVMVAAYGGLVLWGYAAFASLRSGGSVPVVLPMALILVNLALLAWRVLVRAYFTATVDGLSLAVLTPAHMLLGNVVAICAAARALGLYLGMVRHGRVRWDKTAHVFPRDAVILAKNKAAPLRFLLVVTTGWVILRGIMLSGWSPGGAPALRWAPGPSWMDGAIGPWRVAAPARPRALAGAARTIASRAGRRLRAAGAWSPPDGPIRVEAALDDVAMRYLALAGYDQPNRTFYARESYARATAAHEADAVTGGGTAPVWAATSVSRWSGSVWAFVRGGGHTTPLSPVGQIGAGQAGARILYRVKDGLSFAGRLSRTIGGPDQTEAAAGVDWQPVARVPVHLTAERRIAIDRGGRNAFALGAAGGVYAVPLAPGWRLDGYGEAGVVGARRRDLYADGAVRAGRALDLGDGRSLTLGVGAWGAAQPHAARLDAGPSAVLRVPVERRTIAFALDYRARVVGDARPHSGVALTAGVDF